MTKTNFLSTATASIGRRAGKTALALAILSLAPVAALAADVPVKIKKVTSGDVEGYAPGQTSAVTVMCANGVYGTFLLGDGDEASLLAPAGESCAVSETAVTPSGYASTTVITVSGQAPVSAAAAGFTVGATGSTVVVANSLRSQSSSVRLEVFNQLIGPAAGDTYLFADIKFLAVVTCTSGYTNSKWVTNFATATFDLGTVAPPHNCSVSIGGMVPATLPNGYTGYSHYAAPPTFMAPASGSVRVSVLNRAS